MIDSPRKSVTRFFVPLIDVLILLFCIFLLMPFVSGPQVPEPTPETTPTPEKPLPKDVESLQKEVKSLRVLLKEEKLRVSRLEKERATKITDRLVVRVMDIDPVTGILHYYDPDRRDVKTEADAVSAINRLKAVASKDGVVKDVFFLIRYPRGKSNFPNQEQLDRYEQWFKDVPFGYDVP